MFDQYIFLSFVLYQGAYPTSMCWETTGTLYNKWCDFQSQCYEKIAFLLLVQGVPDSE